MKNKKIKKIILLKGKRKIVSLTSYTFPISKILNRYCDFILVGDSVGTVHYGMKSTREVTLDMMIAHSKSVKLGAKKNLILVDMPYKTYQNKFDAYANANKIIKNTKCDGVKLEGGKELAPTIKKLITDGILVSTPAGSTAYNMSVHGPILSLNSNKLSISPISAFRPRRWKGKIVSDKSIIKIKNLNPIKRPISAVADNIEVRNAKIITIKTNKNIKFNLLYDANRSLQKKIKIEQLRRETS